MAIKVLYIHPSGTFGGASRSLLEMISAFPEGTVDPFVITPRGSVSRAMETKGVPTQLSWGIAQFNNTQIGYFRGLRWLILLRELAFILTTWVSLLKARRRWREIDLIHGNEITALPAALLAKFIFRVPLVIHVRSVQRPLTATHTGRAIEAVIRRYVERLIVIDQTVAESLPPDLAKEIIHNGFTPPPSSDRSMRTESSRPFTVGFVGVLLELKGVYDLLDAARICAERGLQIKFLFVGDNARPQRGLHGLLLAKLGFSKDVRRDIEEYVTRYNLHDVVTLRPFTYDIEAVYRNIDVLCFPSHLNACGRPVFEAAFFRVPSIVAVMDPKDDTIMDGITGICVSERNPEELARSIEHLYRNEETREAMGDMAYRLAVKNFDIGKNAKAISDLYKGLTN